MFMLLSRDGSLRKYLGTLLLRSYKKSVRAITLDLRIVRAE